MAHILIYMYVFWIIGMYSVWCGYSLVSLTDT